MALTRPKIWDLDTTIEAFVDPITVLHQGSSSANVDVGFLFNRANGLVSNVALYWSESLQSFVTTYTTSTGVINSNIVVTSYANLTIGSLFSINGNIYLNGLQGTPGQYITATSSGTAWTSSSFTGGVISSTTYPSANLSINLGTTTGYWANVYTGNLIVGQNVLWGNGTVFSSGTGGAGTYSNANVASYLPTYSGTFGGDITVGGNLTVTGNTIFRNSEIVVGVEIVTGNLVANSGVVSTSNVTGALVVVGGVGVSGNVYTNNRVGFVYANSVSSVYTIFNQATASYDIVFG